MTVRSHRVATDPLELEPNDHVDWAFEGPGGFSALAVPFLRAGLDSGDRLLCVLEYRRLDLLAGLGNVEGLVAEGRLQVQTLDDVYGNDGVFDPTQQAAVFATAVEATKADGYRALRVAADCTPMARRGPRSFARWMAWEHRADEFIAGHDVIGVCGFDQFQLPRDVLDDLSTVHPVISKRSRVPDFRLFVDEGMLHVVGALDTSSAEQFGRVLALSRPDGPLVLDLGEAEFVNHSALVALHRFAESGLPVRLRNARPLLRDVWRVLELETPYVTFEPEPPEPELPEPPEPEPGAPPPVTPPGRR